MNITSHPQLYTIAQKASLPFVSIPCAIICLLFYKYGRKRLNKKETIDSRMINLYSAVAGGTLGQFFFHTLPNSTIDENITLMGSSNNGYSTISVFIILGFYIMLCIQKCGRVCTEHAYYTAPETTSVEVGYTLDPDSMSQNEYLHADDLQDNNRFKTQMWTVRDEIKEVQRRLTISTLFIIIMLFVGVLEGFFLVYKVNNNDITHSPGLLIFMYYINKMIQTVIYCIVMLYGLYHIPTDTRNTRAYWVFGFLWCVSIIFSTFPVELEMSKFTAGMVLNNSLLSIVYACLGGILFWMALYFVWIDRRHTDIKDTVKRLILFAVFIFASYMTGYFI